LIEIVADPGTELCSGDSLELMLTQDFPLVIWSTGDTTSTLTVTEPGDFTATAISQEGCTSEAIITITEIPSPEVMATADNTSIEPGGAAQLNATGALSFLWSPGESLNDSTIFNPVSTPDTTTTYEVLGIDENGCFGTDRITIEVTGDPAGPDLAPAKVFSPNGDAINDFWVIGNIENFPNCRLLIFNRNGKEVFAVTGYQNDWDGTFEGDPLRSGVYYFVIRCNGDENTLTGSITLIR